VFLNDSATTFQEKEMQKAKRLSGEALQTVMKRRKAKGKGEKERCTISVLYGAHLCMKCSLDISNFLAAISSLSHSIVFLYFFALITEEGFHVSPCSSLGLYIQMGTSFFFSFAFRFSSFHNCL